MSLKHYKKTNSFRNSTGTLRIDSKNIAYSYGWYKLGMPLGTDIYLINNYSYSNTTNKHARILYRYIEKHYSKVIWIECPKGLNNLEIALSYNLDLRMNIKKDLINKRKRKSTKERLHIELIELESKIELIQSLIQKKG